MKIKKNDTVKILNGKDKGKTGKVLRVFPNDSKNDTTVVVEGLNLRYKHTRAKSEREKGQRVMFPFPVKISNIALVCPKCNKVSRVGYKVLENKIEGSKENKQRICKKCGVVI